MVMIESGQVHLPVDPLSLDEALALWKELRGLLRDAEWPQMVVVPATPETDDEEGEPRRLRCPRCGGESTEVICEDRSGPRWTDLEVDGRDRPFVTAGGDYGSPPDCHTFLYLCKGCEEPVRLPEGWREL